ncbi:MAG TPA: SMP-30/gluconolactonase/LRE family protein [Bryobacteraceae bacterium]|nr:SMP-30/gluconolactonase/LRE family protein [Bryobacteraceae bacterium]
MNVVALSLLAVAVPASVLAQSIEKLDPALDKVISPTAKIQKIAGGFIFTEGPLWYKDGSLLFSDVPGNTIYKRTADGKVSVFRKPSGYDKNDAPQGAYVGSNGLSRDPQGRLIICEHGNGRVTRLDKDGKLTVLADRYEGKRLNSPNDLTWRKDGSLYFTDPPYGFPKQDDDPKKELKHNGIYRIVKGNLELLNTDLTRPNGIAFSPDEKYLYVANSDAAKKVWYRFDVQPDGRITNGRVFVDASKVAGDGVPDGMKVDRQGNLIATGPGGVWIISPTGKHLGTIKLPEVPANVAWGGQDGKTLFITATTSVYQVPMLTGGQIP